MNAKRGSLGGGGGAPINDNKSQDEFEGAFANELNALEANEEYPMGLGILDQIKS